MALYHCLYIENSSGAWRVAVARGVGPLSSKKEILLKNTRTSYSNTHTAFQKITIKYVYELRPRVVYSALCTDRSHAKCVSALCNRRQAARACAPAGDLASSAVVSRSRSCSRACCLQACTACSCSSASCHGSSAGSARPAGPAPSDGLRGRSRPAEGAGGGAEGALHGDGYQDLAPSPTGVSTSKW